MSFRTSTYGYSNNYMKDLQISYGNYSKLLEQADGSKLHRASDDSVGYGKYLRYQNTITSNIQYQSNTTTALLPEPWIKAPCQYPSCRWHYWLNCLLLLPSWKTAPKNL